jgi:hypothetical protein
MICLDANPGCRGGNRITNRLRYGIALFQELNHCLVIISLAVQAGERNGGRTEFRDQEWEYCTMFLTLRGVIEFMLWPLHFQRRCPCYLLGMRLDESGALQQRRKSLSLTWNQMVIQPIPVILNSHCWRTWWSWQVWYTGTTEHGVGSSTILSCQYSFINMLKEYFFYIV